MLSASVLYDRGVALSNAGRHAAARRALEAASERTRDDNLLARIAGTMAFVVSETGQAEEATELCRRALHRRGLTEHTRAVLLGQQGLIELRRGELTTARTLLTKCLPGLANDEDRASSVFMNRGVVNLELGLLPEALADFSQAARRFTQLGLADDAAKAQHNQGYASLLGGDLVEASRLMDAARPLAAAASPVDAAVGDVDRAEVLLAAGLPDEATVRLASAIRVYRAHRLRQLQADATWRLARTLSYSDPRSALSLATKASRLYRAHGNETGALRADAVALRARVGQGAGSIAVIERIAEVAAQLATRHLSDEAADLRASAARVMIRRGDLAAARATLRRARIRKDAPIVSRTLAHEVRTELAVSRGDDRAALRAAARGLDELGSWQSLFGSLDLQSSLSMHGRALTLAGVAAALRGGDAATIFDWSERARQLATHNVLPRPSDDPVVAEALGELRMLRFSGELAGEPARKDAALRDLVTARRWQVEGTGRAPERVSLDRVQSMLADDEAVVIAYLWSGEALAALVIEADRSCIVPLGCPPIGREASAALQAELDVCAARLPGSMGEAVEKSLAERLAALSAELVDPVLAASKAAASSGTRLAIITPGILAGIPWPMLPGLAGRIITLPMSATRWMSQRTLPVHRPGSAPAAAARAGFVAGPGVPRAAEEVTRSADAWRNADTATGADATVDRAAHLATTVDVLHITGHGRHAVDNPHFSGVELADGPWFGYDIELLTRIPPVVLLSACELGRSAVSWGHEALGMARTWLYAGARCVIASPANVNDDEACELLAVVHERLATGAAPATALAAAGADTGVATPFLSYGSGW